MINLYIPFYILKLADAYKLEVAKCMHQLHNIKLSKSLYTDYVKMNETLSFITRQVQNVIYFKPRINKL